MGENQYRLCSGLVKRFEDMTRRPSLIISIGRERYEVGVNTEITPLHHQPAEVIPIDQGTRPTKAAPQMAGQPRPREFPVAFHRHFGHARFRADFTLFQSPRRTAVPLLGPPSRRPFPGWSAPADCNRVSE